MKVSVARDFLLLKGFSTVDPIWVPVATSELLSIWVLGFWKFPEFAIVLQAGVMPKKTKINLASQESFLCIDHLGLREIESRDIIFLKDSFEKIIVFVSPLMVFKFVCCVVIEIIDF